MARPPATIKTGKYQSAVYNIPAAPPKNTSSRVSLSVMAFWLNCTAASNTIPTVAALRPDSRAYTGSGRLVLTLWIPRERAYMPTAPGRLSKGLEISLTEVRKSEAPPEQEGEYSDDEAAMHTVDTKQHFRTSRPRQRLGNGKEFLVLRFASELSFYLLGRASYHLFVDPFMLFYKKLMELCKCLSMYGFSCLSNHLDEIDLLFESVRVARQKQ